MDVLGNCQWVEASTGERLRTGGSANGQRRQHLESNEQHFSHDNVSSILALKFTPITYRFLDICYGLSRQAIVRTKFLQGNGLEFTSFFLRHTISPNSPHIGNVNGNVTIAQLYQKHLLFSLRIGVYTFLADKIFRNSALKKSVRMINLCNCGETPRILD